MEFGLNSTFKRIYSVFFSLALLAAVSQDAKATPFNVELTADVLGGGSGLLGVANVDTWTLSFIVDDAAITDPNNDTWTGFIQGSVIGTSTNGYTATYGPTGGQTFSLTTGNIGAPNSGNVTSASFSDVIAAGDHFDSIGGAIPSSNILHAVNAAVGFFVSGSNQGSDFVGLFSGTVSVIDSNDEEQVPEPGALALIGIGLVGLGIARRQRKSRNKKHCCSSL